MELLLLIYYGGTIKSIYNIHGVNISDRDSHLSFCNLKIKTFYLNHRD